jgi:hypothetical protein
MSSGKNFSIPCLGMKVFGFDFRFSGFSFSGFGFRFSVSGHDRCGNDDVLVFDFQCVEPGFGFRVSGFGFRVSDFGFRVSGLVYGLGFRLQDLCFMV